MRANSPTVSKVLNGMSRVSVVRAFALTTTILVLTGCPPTQRDIRERCGTKPVSINSTRRAETLIEQSQLRQEPVDEKTSRLIPVFFHVINKGPDQYTDGNVSMDQIQQQMAELNRAYATTSFQFYLAADVDYRTIPQWFEMTKPAGDEVEQALGIKRKDALNVYTANLEGADGWAVDPREIPTNPYKGVMVLFSTLPGGNHYPNNLGGTLVHEVGHWLGLFHTFENACNPPGDHVEDTPAEERQAVGCWPGRNTCYDDDLPDPVDNVMDYSPDNCMQKSFTHVQIQHMNQTFVTYRQRP